jgi:hypothetical protein
MTPKEKAKKLYNRYKGYLPSGIEPDLFKALSRQLALVCVDEIIDTNPLIEIGESDSGSDYIQNDYYWEEVREELREL